MARATLNLRLPSQTQGISTLCETGIELHCLVTEAHVMCANAQGRLLIESGTAGSRAGDGISSVLAVDQRLCVCLSVCQKSTVLSKPIDGSS